MREERLVTEVTNMLNGSFSNKAFCDSMQREHRTLQQAFTELCYEWLKTCASDDYKYDGRNEASHITAKHALEGLEMNGYNLDYNILPFI